MDERCQACLTDAAFLWVGQAQNPVEVEAHRPSDACKDREHPLPATAESSVPPAATKQSAPPAATKQSAPAASAEQSAPPASVKPTPEPALQLPDLSAALEHVTLGDPSGSAPERVKVEHVTLGDPSGSAPERVKVEHVTLGDPSDSAPERVKVEPGAGPSAVTGEVSWVPPLGMPYHC